MRDEQGRTPLLHGLVTGSNAELVGLAASARLLLTAGDTPTSAMTDAVTELGRRFEQARDGFNLDTVDAAATAVHELYGLFGAQPAALVRRHDGTSEIIVPDGDDATRFAALWKQLVPASGNAATTQGEAVRVAGRLGHEISDNAGVNWNRGFRRMADALPGYLAIGDPLPPNQLTEAKMVADVIRRGHASNDQIQRLMALVVQWVKRNPQPIPLGRVAYRH